jgi:hypothetical protein
MTRVILDKTLRKKLHDLEGPLELCDESGAVVARLFPQYDPAKHDLNPKISPDELLRRKTSDEKVYTTTEVLAHLDRQ